MPFFFARNRWLLGVLASISLLSVGACHRGEDREPIAPYGPETAGRDYYPLAVGQWREYAVTQHTWTLNRDSVARFLQRERVDTLFRGAGGELTYRIVRSRRPDSLHVWRDDSVLAVVVTDAEVRQTFSNVPRLELLFGIWEGRSWNPGLYSGDSTVRTYQRVGEATTLPNGRRYARTVRAVDQPDTSIVHRREQEQTYAWGVGRIWRRRVRLEYCNSDEVSQGLCQLGSGYVVRGTQREEYLLKWGPQ